MSRPLNVIQLTDLHIKADPNGEAGQINTRQSFSKVLQAVKREVTQIDLLLLTGDLADEAELEAYEHLRQQLAFLNLPCHMIAGNHDDLLTMLDMNFSDTKKWPDNCLINQHYEDDNWLIINLDSSAMGEVLGSGIISVKELNRLQNLLGQNNKPTVVTIHHPPIEVPGCLENSNDLIEILNDYPQVKLVLCGHVHRELMGSIGSGIWLSTPATCFQMRVSNGEMHLDPNARPGFRLLKLYPNGHFQSQVVRVDL